jgi:hypothetical protein
MLQLSHVSLLCPSKNDVALKITIRLVIDHYWILIKIVILRATSFLEGQKSDTRGSCRITLTSYAPQLLGPYETNIALCTQIIHNLIISLSFILNPKIVKPIPRKCQVPLNIQYYDFKCDQSLHSSLSYSGGIFLDSD